MGGSCAQQCRHESTPSARWLWRASAPPAGRTPQQWRAPSAHVAHARRAPPDCARQWRWHVLVLEPTPYRTCAMSYRRRVVMKAAASYCAYSAHCGCATARTRAAWCSSRRNTQLRMCGRATPRPRDRTCPKSALRSRDDQRGPTTPTAEPRAMRQRCDRMASDCGRRGPKSRPWGYETCALPNAISPRASRRDKRLRAWWRALRRSRCAWRTSWLQRHGAMHGTCCDTIGEVPRARC